MKHILLPALIGLLALCLLFPACEETEDPAGPDSTSGDLTGTWVRYSFTVEGETVATPAVDIIRANGTGTAWYDDDGTWTSQNYTWTLDEDTLQLVLERDGNHSVLVHFQSDNRVVFEHEADGGSWVDIRFRMIDTVDQAVVGDWMMTAQSHEGTPAAPDPIRVVINADGTGSYTDPEETATFTWCAVENFLVVLESDNQGFVLGYTVESGTLSFTEIREDGAWLMTFSPYEEPTVDPAFIGTWVREAIYINESYRDIDAVVTFRDDGTGTSIEEDPETNEVMTYTFTWTASAAILNMVEDEGEWETNAFYVVNGNRCELSYDFIAGNFIVPAEDIFYKQTGDLPTETLGTWVQSEPYVGDGYVEMEVTFVVDADGSLQIESRYYDQSEPYWEEDSFVWQANWSMSEDRMLIMDPESGLGMAYPWSVSGNEAVLSHPSMGTRTFLLNEGEYPSEAIGTWAPYHFTLNGELQETLVMELRLHDDGTAMVVMLDNGDESEGVTADSMNWVARDNKVLLTSLGTTLCEVMEYSINDDQMTINRQEFMDEDGALEPMEVSFAKRSGELNPDAYGTWEKFAETRDGVDYPDYDNVTLVFNDDGSATYTDTSGETQLSWSWTPGSQYAVSSFMIDGHRLSQASVCSISDNTLTITTFIEKDGVVVTLAESYTRQ